MANFAVLSGAQVTNVIAGENKDELEAILGLTLVEYTDDNPASIGDIWNGTEFVSPTPTDQPTE